jgi:hypothetical protein
MFLLTKENSTKSAVIADTKADINIADIAAAAWAASTVEIKAAAGAAQVAAGRSKGGNGTIRDIYENDATTDRPKTNKQTKKSR